MSSEDIQFNAWSTEAVPGPISEVYSDSVSEAAHPYRDQGTHRT